MFTLAIPAIKDMLYHLTFRKKRTVMIWGPPGGGKSDGVAQFCDMIGGYLWPLHLASYDSVDLHGLPSTEEEYAVWKPPATLPFEVNGKPNPNFPTDRPIVLFFDEVTSASTGVFAVLYQLTLEGRVNEHKLMDNVLIVMAGNREGDRGVVNRMPTPLSNRVTHVEAGVDAEAWTYDYAIPNNVSPVGIAFFQFKPDLLMTFDPTSGEKAFATPRSVTKALEYLEDDDMPQLVKTAAIHGTIGAGVASELLAFADTWDDMIPLSSVRADPKTCPVPDDEHLSTQHAMAVAISGDMNADNAHVYHTYLKRMGDVFVTLAWSMAMRRNNAAEERGQPDPKPVENSPAYMDFARDYRAVWAG